VDEKTGFAAETCRMPGEGPTWIGGLVVLRDDDGRERLHAGYVKVRPSMEVYEQGLVVFNDESSRFEKVATFPKGTKFNPQAHAFRHEDGGTDYIYFATAYPHIRVRARVADLADPAHYEGFTCLVAGTKPEDEQIDRDASGQIRYGWKANTPPLDFDRQEKFLRRGLLKPGEGLLVLRDIATGKTVRAHNGSVNWNDYRKKWVMIVCEVGGSSFLGETWYAEADAPTGPWIYARKIVTHEKYSFYNPKQHPHFDKEGGRVIFFEGTYTRTFSGNTAEPTPRYDYNQVMYKLDLSDPRLNLPAPVKGWGFYALDRPGEGTIPVFEDRAHRLTTAPPDGDSRPLFHAIPADTKERPPGTALLYEFLGANGQDPTYGTGGADSVPGHRRSERPLCLVWEDPVRVALPRH
jgi:hypothetical protein